MVMVRKQLYLPESLDQELTAEAKRRGISQAELIRMRLEGRSIEVNRRPRTKAEEAARQEAVQALLDIRAKMKPGSGTGWKFNRQEIYDERFAELDRRRLERARLRDEHQ